MAAHVGNTISNQETTIAGDWVGTGLVGYVGGVSVRDAMKPRSHFRTERMLIPVLPYRLRVRLTYYFIFDRRKLTEFKSWEGKFNGQRDERGNYHVV